MDKINIIIVGCGMYVCGKGTDGFGTILPSILKFSANDKVNEVWITGAREESHQILRDKLAQLEKLMALKINLKCIPGRNIEDQLSTILCEKKSESFCAIISTPDHLHFSHSKFFLTRNIPLLVVKPLTPTFKEGLELTDLAKKNQIYAAVEFHKRFDRANLKIRDDIQTGKIGTPLYNIIEYSQRKIIPEEIFSSWAETTNIFQYLAVHYVDITYFTCKATPVRVSAIGQYGYLKEREINSFDSVLASIEWKLPNEEKFISQISCNWIDPNKTSSMSDQRIKFIGTKGRIESNQKNRGYTIVNDSSGIDEPNPDFCQFYQTGSNNENKFYDIVGYGPESIITFLNDIINLKEGKTTLDFLNKNRPSIESALVSTQVIDAANTSLKEDGKWVEISKS